ncbi:uncharacterized protein F5147DRAFT_657092 [Suillus discolor]|uniref:Uncharacterized protein n=1 Tax=Suillus discolor TaxID=1912936 RepID=A0A9P7EY11_9AGAM|nr:uncharacterized protein F5147DRAFT_657092 [Suillus discolor]KAG2094610.1 hypothetical protein F5147DRAFT_657092 [Suillus discolor]
MFGSGFDQMAEPNHRFSSAFRKFAPRTGPNQTLAALCIPTPPTAAFGQTDIVRKLFKRPNDELDLDYNKALMETYGKDQKLRHLREVAFQRFVVTIQAHKIKSHIGHLPLGKYGYVPINASQKASRPQVHNGDSGSTSNTSHVSISFDNDVQFSQLQESNAGGSGRNGMLSSGGGATLQSAIS